MDLVRITVAVILLTHPAHAIAHPADVTLLAGLLQAHGVPFALGLAWTTMAVLLASSIALLVPRFIVPGALGSIVVLAGGTALYAPRWYVVGLEDDAKPGVELHVLLLACLAGVVWTYAPRRGKCDEPDALAKMGLEIIRVASAYALLTHGWGPFVLRDVEGMREWGEAMTRHGWPLGVALVWSIKSVELVSSVLRLSRRLVVPACFGHLSYLVPALWIYHKLRWFDIGPGEDGIEFPVLLVMCTVACILAYWPVRSGGRELGDLHRDEGGAEAAAARAA